MKKDFAKHIKSSLLLYIFAVAALLLGIIFGSVCSVRIDGDVYDELLKFVSEFFVYFEDKDIEFSKIFVSALINNLRYVALCILFSLSIYTVFLVYAMLGIRGFSLGFTVSFVVKTKGFNGFLLMLTTVFPSCVITLPIYFLMCVLCIKCAFSRHSIKENYRESKKELKSFLIIMVILFAALMICSLIDTF